MRRINFMLVVVILTCSLPSLTQAQTTSDDEVPRYEIGAQFTSITRPDLYRDSTEIGVGGRFTFNLNRSIALEAVGNFFPHKCSGCGIVGDNSGNITQGFFGVKAGKRFQKWGIFAKARPGFTSFSQADFQYELLSTGGPFPFQFTHDRLTHFSMDLGGVVEFYPSKHIVTRFDFGDTLIRFGQRDTNFISTNGAGTFTLVPYTVPGETRHNFQFSAGVGFRF